MSAERIVAFEPIDQNMCEAPFASQSICVINLRTPCNNEIREGGEALGLGLPALHLLRGRYHDEMFNGMQWPTGLADSRHLPPEPLKEIRLCCILSRLQLPYEPEASYEAHLAPRQPVNSLSSKRHP